MMVESKKATESLEINYWGQGGPGRLTGAQQNECSEEAAIHQLSKNRGVPRGSQELPSSCPQDARYCATHVN